MDRDQKIKNLAQIFKQKQTTELTALRQKIKIVINYLKLPLIIYSIIKE